MDDAEPHTWTTDQVSEWLTEHGFSMYCNLFCSIHHIDGHTLLQLTEDDLKQPPVSMQKLGDIKRIINELNKLRTEAFLRNPSLVPLFPESLNQKLPTSISTNGLTRYFSATNQFQPFQPVRTKPLVLPQSLTPPQCSTPSQSISHQLDLPSFVDQQPSIYGDAAEDIDSDSPTISTFLEPEFFKLIISSVYLTVSLMLTTFVMVIVHDRVPDMAKYPPLPDIVLDNVPHIPWAFEACEALMVTLGGLLLVVLVFHKHRFIIMRRLFALTGTVFLLRCVTMLITSLSVPGSHLQCHPRGLKSFKARVETALSIYTGLGMSIKGVQTCGDYMFSGHTVVTTMFNFFLNEYTPRSIPMLHTLGWVFNFFAIFFILAGHEHYSIDVFIAFYITSRLFLYYHSLANNRVLIQRDARTRIWFPLFTFFEFSMDGVVPNEYELPWMTFFRFVVRQVRRWFGLQVNEESSPAKTSPIKRSLSISSFGIVSDRRKTKEKQM
ncbi:hypothetical protein HELRODRAFT_100598 [Helobdella robusta]|uniref:SAM domain-containing protein n=1 Tax=Helobdella robusta TaxID=6412 RepID=T1ED07_HELRO|nr:hypothetical protein HELRODRAFT_100598 [Helobdella robusta]ESO01311.1 hypothetical protein HELRODRAFT_100598 [Helobdella robusta]